MTDILDLAKSYLKANAAETGADVLIEELAKEVSRLRAALLEIKRMAATSYDGVSALVLIDVVDAALNEQLARLPTIPDKGDKDNRGRD